ncbi:MAG: TIGR02680 family protein [Azoarcus sp.]
MTEALLQAPPRPSLPVPQLERWQPLRIGLVELFHYDSEEFWFHDGHLLLRGNNGTGKSKVLSLTLPLLFDAQLRSSRVEPDGDSGKKMAWNLLVNSYPRRTGYSWIEFGRRDRDGSPHYLTLGVGLSAVAGRPKVESWYFVLEGDDATPAPRLGQLFESGQSYRRAVDERLFHLGQRRYDALMDTLIQLRQPQLSKKPDETGLSNALSESLPPLPVELLGDVAEALNQLEEDRNQLEEARRLEQAVSQFEHRYRRYTGLLARRQARELRQAQTGFDNASEARNRAHALLEHAREAEAAATRTLEAAKQAMSKARTRVETLQSDPANQDANRLTQADNDARQRREAAANAVRQRDDAASKLQRETERSRQRGQQVKQVRTALEDARAHTLEAAGSIGVEADIVINPLLALRPEVLASTPPAPRDSTDALHTVVSRRRQDIVRLRQRHAEVDRQQTASALAEDNVQAARAELDESLEQRGQADLRAEQEAEALLDAWANYSADLVALRFDDEEPLRELADWAARPDGDNPARAALETAWQAALQGYAERQAKLDAQRETLLLQSAELKAERERLLAGEDAVPPQSITRAPDVRRHRHGAPLWQLVDFQPQLKPEECAGLEAALEASGLLDAWLSPDGSLRDSDGQALLDTSWVRRAGVTGASLNDALIPALPDGCPVAETTLAALLDGAAYGLYEPADAEIWLSPDGRFRLGALAGAWGKSEAHYIGHTARERARQRRLAEIVTALAELDAVDAELQHQFEALKTNRQSAEQERQGMPSDRPLHAAIAAATSAGNEVNRASQRLEQANARHRQMEAALQTAREQLRHDAADLRLPPEPEWLSDVEQALETFDQAQAKLARAANDWQRDWPAYLEQQQRESEAGEMLERTEDMLIQAEEQAEQAASRFETLQQSIGQKVDDLLQALRDAKGLLNQAETRLEESNKALRNAGEKRAIAETEARQKEEQLTERTTERQQAVEGLHRFADSGLLASALPYLALPESWSVDPALNLARRVEQALTQLDDSDNAWTRVQRQIAEDLTELQRALSALGHQAISEPNDWGFSVHIQYQNRAENPATLAALLAEDIAQRSELLSAREREVLENHLQAEIAAELQRLMRAADERIHDTNEELHKRPTSTGVRYRLQWEPLTVDEGAPAGLDVARTRLLNTSSDLWSVEDRRAVGSMLQQQIAAERTRSDADATGRSLIDQLARALDYRHWHRFRIQRQQDGQWRKLSGPASSGERALGLTVPLFAAIASFYGHGGSPLAPRLMLLDEAFAGIDDAARAHCMGLIREFDLDFVITSEREWACYAELPGVAICQLQRREGIDAVFVSRWTWDGREKRAESDPDRRFPPP